MAHIKTVDNETHRVRENLIEVGNIIDSQQRKGCELIPLTLVGTTTSYDKERTEINNVVLEPVYFIKSNIILILS